MEPKGLLRISYEDIVGLEHSKSDDEKFSIPLFPRTYRSYYLHTIVGCFPKILGIERHESGMFSLHSF